MSRLRAAASPVRRQRGMTLIEGLLAGSLMVIVLIAVTGVAMSFTDRATDTGDLIGDHESARDAVGRISFELRSAAPGQTGAVLLRSEPGDLAFASDSLAEAVGDWRTARYCWSGSQLLRQVGPGAAAPSVACPDPSWSTPVPVADAVTTAPFGYSYSGATPTVTITLGAGAARPLESAVSVRNRSLAADAIGCQTTNADNALVSIGLGVGPAVTIPVKVGDLIGLRTLLFGEGPTSDSWECP